MTGAFREQVSEHIERALAAAENEEKARRRLAGQIGTSRTLEDLRDLNGILKARDALAHIADRLPGHIRNLADAHLDAVKAVLDAAAVNDLLPYALILVMSRLAAPWQLIRIAVKAAQTDHAVRVAATPYARAVAIVLAEMERMVGEFKNDLKRGGGAPVTSLLKCIHDAARGCAPSSTLPAIRLGAASSPPSERRFPTCSGPRSNPCPAGCAACCGRARRSRSRRARASIPATSPIPKR